MAVLNTPIPKALVEELEKRFPQRCIKPFQDMNSALFYSGKVELVSFLRSCYEAQQEDILTKGVDMPCVV